MVGVLGEDETMRDEEVGIEVEAGCLLSTTCKRPPATGVRRRHPACIYPSAHASSTNICSKIIQSARVIYN